MAVAVASAIAKCKTSPNAHITSSVTSVGETGAQPMRNNQQERSPGSLTGEDKRERFPLASQQGKAHENGNKALVHMHWGRGVQPQKRTDTAWRGDDPGRMPGGPRGAHQGS